MWRLSGVFLPLFTVYFHSRPGPITSARLDVSSSSGDMEEQAEARRSLPARSFCEVAFEGWQGASHCLPRTL